MSDLATTLAERDARYAVQAHPGPASMMPSGPGPGWNLVLLQHTGCGITRLAGQPDVQVAS